MTKQTAEPDSMPPSAGTSLLRRWLPPLVLLALGLCGYGLGLHRYLSLSTLAEHREALRQGVEAHFALALAAFALTYAGVVALSIPGAGLMSLAGGFLFGWALSAPVTILSATVGASGRRWRSAPGLWWRACRRASRTTPLGFFSSCG